MTLAVRRVGPEAAPTVLEIVRAAFAARPPVDPPADALGETVESLAAALAHGGLVAASDGRDVGALVLAPEGPTLWLRRVGVVPEVREHGVATALVTEALAGAEGYDEVAVLAREELPGTGKFWREHGFGETARHTPYVELRRPAPTSYDVPDAEAMRSLGTALAGVLRAGDVVVLSGGLGAGKTTFTQGLGAGLGVRGDVTSPTFVIARVHPSLADGPAFVHVDAYRIGGVAELDDLDLDTSLDEAVTVVEWGEGLAEGLADDRVEVWIERAVADDCSRRPRPAPGARLARGAPLARRTASGTHPLSSPRASASRSTSAGSSSCTRSQAAASATGRVRTSTTASPSGGFVGGPVSSTSAVAKAHAESGCGKCGWCGAGLRECTSWWANTSIPPQSSHPASSRSSRAARSCRVSPASRRPPGRNRHSWSVRHTTTRPSGTIATRCRRVTSASSGAPSRKARSALA